MRIDILGPVQVRDGDEVVAVPRRVERALLAVLALHPGQVVRLQPLAEALWAEDPPPTATRSLSSHMSRVRRRLGPDVARPESGGYRMALDGYSTDVAEMQRLVTAGRDARREGALLTARESFAAAEGLWRGEPLEDLAEGLAKTAQVQRLEDLRWRATEGRLSVDLDLGRHEQVMDEAHAIVADDPLRERAWHLLLLAQYRSGRQIDALRSYRWLQGLLAAELAADPSPELQRLNWQMQHQDPRLDLRPPRPPLVIPAAVATFVGRAGQIDAVAEALSDSRLVTLHGPAGVGKSRLAQEVARHVRDRYSEGVWWVDLTVAGDLPEVLARLAGTLGVSVPPNASATDVLAAHLRYRELLLVLDNCEHVAGLLLDVVVALLKGAAGLRILATSRLLLDVVGESRWEVPPLPVPVAGTDERSLSASDAVVLFQQRRGARADLAGIDSVADVAELCRRVDGVPLALELMAAKAQRQSVREILAGLGAGVLDSAAAADGTSHHVSLRTTIDWSYSALDGVDQHLFDRLSVFPGDFDLPAAAALTSGVVPADDVLAGLSRLVAACLVQAHSSAGTTRYRLLFVMREFASGRLAERGETHAAMHAFADHYRRLGVAAVPRLGDGSAAVRLDLLGPELVNLREAFTWSVAHEPATATLELIAVLGRLAWGPFLDIAADLQLLRSVVEGAVEAPAEARGWAWLALVPAAYLVGDAPMALEACERGRALFEEAGDTAGVAATSYGRGVALFLAVGDLPAAQASFRDGQRLARNAGAVTLEAWCLAHWVQLQCYAGSPTARTHQMLDQARQLSAESADPLLALQIAQGEATVAYCEGNFDACVETSLHLEALSLQTGSQAIWGQVALLLRGAALLGKHQPEAATSILLRAARNELDGGSRMQLEILLQVLARVADGVDPIRAAQLWGAATVHAPVWPGLARYWFPSRARLALGERFEDEASIGRALPPETAVDLAVGWPEVPVNLLRAKDQHTPAIGSPQTRPVRTTARAEGQ